MRKLHARLRWARLTTRWYGWVYLVLAYRPRHAAVGVGRGPRENQHGRQHGVGVPVRYMIRQLQLERGMAT